MHAKTKYTELKLILSLMYVKKFTSFCRALKKMTQKKIGSYFPRHGGEAAGSSSQDAVSQRTAREAKTPASGYESIQRAT